MKALERFATMVGLRPDLAEDALHSEGAARAVLSRRNLFAAGAAMAAGSAFSFGQAYDVQTIWLGLDEGRVPGSYMQIVYTRGSIAKGDLVRIVSPGVVSLAGYQ